MADEIDRLLGGRLTRRELLKRAGAGAGVLMVPGLISACGGSTTTTAGGATTTAAGATATTLAAPAGTIKIGWVSPLTGPASTFGEVDPYILDVTRKALASGLEVGGKTYAVEFIAKDGQTNPAQGAAVAQELINSDKIDLMLTTSTPETINPVSDACEAAGVPCIAAMCPWEAWYFGRGAKPGEPSPFKWTYLFSFGTQQFIDSFLSSWPQIETNKKIGVMWPNDADGNAIRTAMTPAFTEAGYTVDRSGRLPGRHQRLLLADREVQERGLSDPAGLPAPARLRHLLAADGAARFQTEDLPDTEGGVSGSRDGGSGPHRRERLRRLGLVAGVPV